ncbi:hypothetical protein VTK26DRAFT_3671 [Humicola hyalothermophila]
MLPSVPALLLALCAAFAAADPALRPVLGKRQGTASLGNVTCGRNSYSKQQVDAAVAEGCRLHKAGEQIGSSKYPHRFNNREGLELATDGPYQEFPILPSGVYTGRAPGPDRVVFDPDYRNDCVYAGAMTHTGAATTNGFVLCEEAEDSNGDGATGSPTGTAVTTSTATTTAGPASTTEADENAGVRLGAVGGVGFGAMVVGGLLIL